MIVLYDNPFSPFTRKIRLVLAYKGLAFESVDALALREHESLRRVNPRAEVPALVDGDVTVVNSAEIAAYLEDRYPQPPLLPASPALRVKARHWQRLADTVFDAVIHDISLWMWPTHQRDDRPPDGLIEAGQRDLARLIAELEHALEHAQEHAQAVGPFVCGELSIADLALFPQISAMKTLGVVADPQRFARIAAWDRAMRALPAVRDDLAYVRRSAAEKFGSGPSPYEATKVVWRGDRLEWLFCNGFADWWMKEVAAGRAVVPSAFAGE